MKKLNASAGAGYMAGRLFFRLALSLTAGDDGIGFA